MTRGVARAALGMSGWKDDLLQAMSIARAFDLTSRAMVTSFVNGVAISQGWLLPDAAAVRESAEILELAEQFGDDLTLATARVGRLVVLTHLDELGIETGLEEIAAIRNLALAAGTGPWTPLIDAAAARKRADAGDLDGAIEALRELVENLYDSGEMGWRIAAATALVELLLRRGADSDQHAARMATDRLAAVATEPGIVAHELPLLRLRGFSPEPKVTTTPTASS